MRFDRYLRKLTVALASALATLALAAPVASAVTAEQFLRVHSPADAASAPAPAPEVAADPGFSWAAAGIGAGTAALLIVASVALLAFTGRVGVRTAR